MAIEVKLKKWGNSIGIVIPNETIERLSLKPEEQIVIEISKKENVLKELFGAVKFRRPVEKIVKEARKDLESKWLK
jgi:antitoxin component of MazEF toxin-antitoxin module